MTKEWRRSPTLALDDDDDGKQVSNCERPLTSPPPPPPPACCLLLVSLGEVSTGFYRRSCFHVLLAFNCSHRSSLSLLPAALLSLCGLFLCYSAARARDPPPPVCPRFARFSLSLPSFPSLLRCLTPLIGCRTRPWSFLPAPTTSLLFFLLGFSYR